MPRPSPYTDAQKAKILEAVKAGRKTGKKWPEILKDAEAEGYKGGLQYLMKMARKAGAVRGRRKAKAAAKAAPVAATGKKKLGRPKGGKNAVKRGPGRPKATAVAGDGLGAIDTIVAKMVEERVAVAISKAVASLETAVEALKSI